MFGYVIANREIMSEEDSARYKAVYCGLCRSLRERHGFWGRMTLNYDMTFLVLVLNSMYEPSYTEGCERCFLHPVKEHSFVSSEISEYAADMNIALAYLNQMDNWEDDRNVLSLLYANILKNKYKRVAQRYPRQCQVMTDCLNRLSEFETSGQQEPDGGAKLFGELMGEIFAYCEDRWTPTLRAMGSELGQFIYILDAACDLDADMKKGRFNPLAAYRESGCKDEKFRDILTVLIGNCTMEFEKLPLVDDVSIIRNILCSGVWTKYELWERKRQKEREKTADDI